MGSDLSQAEAKEVAENISIQNPVQKVSQEKSIFTGILGGVEKSGKSTFLKQLNIICKKELTILQKKNLKRALLEGLIYDFTSLNSYFVIYDPSYDKLEDIEQFLALKRSKNADFHLLLSPFSDDVKMKQVILQHSSSLNLSDGLL